MPLTRPILLGLAFFSGTAALVYETIWLRWFRLLFGNTAYAASATLCAFFAGLALGALLFGRLAGRSRHPLRLYAAIEVGAAVAAVAVPALIPLYDPIYAWLYTELAESRPVFLALKFGLAFAACLPAATLLGGTFPVLGACFVGDEKRMGSRGSALYAANTLGAALGSAAGALWLPEWIGVPASYGVALGLSLAVALVAALLARRTPAAAPRPSGGAPRAPTPLLVIAFASGLGTLGFEVLLIHVVAQTLASSIYSFGAVLMVVLAALGLGASLVSLALRRFPAARLLPLALLAEAALLLVLPALISGSGYTAGASGPGSLADGLVLAGLFGGPALLVAGLVLPLTFGLAEGGPVGPRLGGLLAANTLGAIAGSVLASFLLLDGIGLWPSFVALAAVYAAALLLCAGGPGRSLSLLTAGLVAAVVLAGPASPLRLPVARLGAGEHLVAAAEGAHGVVAVVDVVTPRLELDRRLKVDNQYTLSGSLAGPHQRRLGHLPLLIHGAPRRVLYVGTATGETASAALSHPVEEIVLVEIVPEVSELARLHFAEANRGVYDDPRARVVIEDGRNHLRATRERYDVIVADLFVPWRPGVAALYSLEHFRAVARRLTPGGVFCQWLPIYQLDRRDFLIVARTFVQVFPEASLWRGDFLVTQPTAALCGVAKPPAPGVEAIEAAARRLGMRDGEQPWLTEPQRLWMFYAGAVAALPGLAAAPIHSDRRPVFEYAAARSTDARRDAFLGRGWPALWRAVLESAQPVDPILPGRPFESARSGIVLAEASRLVLQERDGVERARALLRANVPRTWVTTIDFTLTEAWPLADGG